jgi:beta-phosphoglucomutase-like phosphatase (HAD superfamily)
MDDYHAVILDVDGVIVDSEPDHEPAIYDVLRELGHDSLHGLSCAGYVGRSDREMWVDFAAKHRTRQTMAELPAMKRKRVIERLLLRRQAAVPGFAARGPNRTQTAGTLTE